VDRSKKQQFVESMLQEDLTERQKQVLAAHDDALSLSIDNTKSMICN